MSGHTVKEVASRLGVHEDTVRREISRGNLVAVRVGTAVRIEEGALYAYLAGHRTSAVAVPPAEPSTGPQRGALGAKSSALAAREGWLDEAGKPDRLKAKQHIKTQAAAMFGRPIASFKDLTRDEGYELLDWLDDQGV